MSRVFCLSLLFERLLKRLPKIGISETNGTPPFVISSSVEISPVAAENLISGKGLGSDVVQSRVGAAARGMRLADLKVAVRSSAQNTESDRNEPCRRALNEQVQ